jgi:hypothetical protein
MALAFLPDPPPAESGVRAFTARGRRQCKVRRVGKAQRAHAAVDRNTESRQCASRGNDGGHGLTASAHHRALFAHAAPIMAPVSIPISAMCKGQLMELWGSTFHWAAHYTASQLPLNARPSPSQSPDHRSPLRKHTQGKPSTTTESNLSSQMGRETLCT